MPANTLRVELVAVSSVRASSLSAPSTSSGLFDARDAQVDFMKSSMPYGVVCSGFGGFPGLFRLFYHRSTCLSSTRVNSGSNLLIVFPSSGVETSSHCQFVLAEEFARTVSDRRNYGSQVDHEAAEHVQALRADGLNIVRAWHRP